MAAADEHYLSDSVSDCETLQYDVAEPFNANARVKPRTFSLSATSITQINPRKYGEPAENFSVDWNIFEDPNFTGVVTLTRVEPDGVDAAYYDSKIKAAERGMYSITCTGSAGSSQNTIMTTIKQLSLTPGLGNFGLKDSLMRGKWNIQPLNKEGKYKKLAAPAFALKRDKDMILWIGEHGNEVAESMVLEDGTRVLITKESIRRIDFDLLIASWVALLWQFRALGEYEGKPFDAEYWKLYFSR